MCVPQSALIKKERSANSDTSEESDALKSRRRRDMRRKRSKSVSATTLAGMVDDLIKLEDLNGDTIRQHLIARFQADVIYVSWHDKDDNDNTIHKIINFFSCCCFLLPFS